MFNEKFNGSTENAYTFYMAVERERSSMEERTSIGDFLGKRRINAKTEFHDRTSPLGLLTVDKRTMAAFPPLSHKSSQ